MTLKSTRTDVTVKLLESSLTRKFHTHALTVLMNLFSACPSTTFAHQGLCVNCPNNCLTCGIDSFHRMFLECKVCQSGYKLDDGQCFKECNSNLGLSMAANGTCLQCADGNCVNCSTNPSVCLKCNILFTLSNGTCLCKWLINFRELSGKYNISSGIIFWQWMFGKLKDSMQRVLDKQLQIKAISKMRLMR